METAPPSVHAAKVKSYRQFCGVAKALDLLGERWTLLIVRDLLLGPRRFNELQHGLAGIPPNVLVKRLGHLEQHGLVERAESEQNSKYQAYSLTTLGREVEAVVLSLGAFGSHFMQAPQAGESLDPRSAVLSLKRRYRGSRRMGVVLMRVEGHNFAVRFGGARIEVQDGAPRRPDVELSGTFSGWFPLLSRRLSLGQLLTDGALSLTGSPGLAQAFVRSIGALA